jgi:hypothetical protein
MRRSTVLLLVLVLGLSACGTSPDNQSGIGEGIAVHGDWVVEVYDADGTLAGRAEFSNHLENRHPLYKVLSGAGSPGPWRIGVDTLEDGACDPPTGCDVVEPEYPDSASFASADLELDRTFKEMTLTGSVVFDNDGTISRIATGMLVCRGTVAPRDCALQPASAYDLEWVTAKEFVYSATGGDADGGGHGITVEAGQQVLIEITITFS